MFNPTTLAARHDARHRSFGKKNGGDVGGATPRAPRPTAFFLTVYLAVLATVFLAACQSAAPPFECTDAIGCVTIGPDEPVKLAALQTLTGEVGTYGIEQVSSSELAIAERGAELLGHPLELQREDELCTEEGGTTGALKIVADPQVVAILGTLCSGPAVPAAKIMSEKGLVMISPSNTAPSLTAMGGEQGADWQPGYFRTAHNDADQGRAAAIFAFQELGVRRAATINDGDTYTEGLTGVFNRVFTELGGEIVLATAVNKGDSDMRPVLTSVIDSGAELVFFPLFQPEADFIVLQSKEVDGFENITLMAADAVLATTFIEAIGTDGVGMYWVGPTSPTGPDYDNFVTNFEQKFARPPGNSPYHAHAYDATTILLDAIEKVAIQDTDGTLHLGRQALREAVYATSGYQGLTGSLTCSEFGDCGAAKFKVVRLDDPAAGIEGLADNAVYTYTPEQ
jgi:branched-chain amino acid transport system substrate-binding protein